MKTFILWIKNQETGQGMVEYGLIIALVAIAAMIGLKIFGIDLDSMYTSIGNDMKE